MKRALYCVVTVLQIALLVGCVIFEKLSKTKMGVMRHVVYTNSKWEKRYPIMTLKYSIIFLLMLAAVLFALFLFRSIRGKRPASLFPAAAILLFILLAGGGALTILLASKQTWRTYYYISTALTAVILLQLPKAIYGLHSLKK